MGAGAMLEQGLKDAAAFVIERKLDALLAHKGGNLLGGVLAHRWFRGGVAELFPAATRLGERVRHLGAMLAGHGGRRR